MSIYEFGPFVLDVSERWVKRGGERLTVSGKSFEVLRLLVDADGRLVDRDLFNARLWPNVTVEDRNLTVHISTLRKMLNGKSASADFIETVSRTGYRLAVPVRPMTAPSESPAPPPRPPASEAHLLQLEARAQLAKVERVPALKALALFERALAVDPDHAAALSGLAATYLLMASTTIRRPLPVDEAVRLASEAAHRALAQDEHQGDAWAVLGRAKFFYGWDWSGAEADFRRAVAADPRSVDAFEGQGWLQAALGRYEPALRSLDQAHRLDPLRRQTMEYIGLAAWIAGDIERSLKALADAVAIEPTARRPHFRRMIVLDGAGRHDEAMAERTRWLELFEDAAFADRLAMLRRADGHRSMMEQWIGRLERLNQWFEAALQWMVVGERGRALDALERSVADRSDQVPFLWQFPSLRPLADEPRYCRLLGEAGLEGHAGPRP